MRKILIFTVIAIFTLSLINFVFAADVVMDLNTSTSNDSSNNNQAISDESTNSQEDNTIYSSQGPDESTLDEYLTPTTSSVTTDDIENSAELSVSNMINIILIVVGVVLILLGIAIILRLK